MIDFIEGTIADKGHNEVIINAGGVGFLLQCSMTTVSSAPAAGEKWHCHTILNVREDAMELYGFATKQERDMFRRLCSVSGVGAKTALGVLSALPLKDLSVAIVTGDVTSLARAPGIGKKTAQRIAMELKDKIEQADVTLPAGAAGAGGAQPAASAEKEAQAALQALGYTAAEAARAINQVRDKATETDQLIMLALRQIGSLG
ncbi:MAG: Holliday junction branch migration protein RuvA [Clostridia bacterium]|nr:Holliday junction branch migration protein RuvA [Clostridia bacterium]